VGDRRFGGARRLLYAHEFAWDRERDPVWPRLQKVFAWYEASDRLDAANGRGNPEPVRLCMARGQAGRSRNLAPRSDL
jgi:hypothetical protein